MFRLFKQKPKPEPQPGPFLQPSHVAEFNAQIETLTARVKAIGEQLEQAIQHDSAREKAMQDEIDALTKENAWLKNQLAEKSGPPSNES